MWHITTEKPIKIEKERDKISLHNQSENGVVILGNNYQVVRHFKCFQRKLKETHQEDQTGWTNIKMSTIKIQQNEEL